MDSFINLAGIILFLNTNITTKNTLRNTQFNLRIRILVLVVSPVTRVESHNV